MMLQSWNHSNTHDKVQDHIIEACMFLIARPTSNFLILNWKEMTLSWPR